MQALTPKQQSKLLANEHIKDVSEKSVTFMPDFKVKSVHDYLAGVPPLEIFKKAKIPVEFFKEDYPRLTIKRWVEKYRKSGEESLREDGRGSGARGRPKKERLEDLSYDELMAIIEIQKGAFAELKKQRALEKKKR